MTSSTEAPASVTYSLISPNGFPILFTMRDEKVSSLLNKMTETEKLFIDNNYKPQEKKTFGAKTSQPKEYVPDRKCPVCGSPLVYQTTKAGVKFIKCSTQTYDFKTQTKGGCQFTEWPSKDPVPTKVQEDIPDIPEDLPF